MPSIHRKSDKRSCGASTIVRGQTTVYANNLLVSVENDINTHGNGQLKANNNNGSVYVNGKKVVFNGSSAKPDGLTHSNPKAAQGSPNVFADNNKDSGGSSDADGSGSTFSDAAGAGAASGGSANPPPVDNDIKDVDIDQQGFCKGVDVYNRLIDDGYSPAAAAGMVGNILHESDQFNADIEYGTGIGRGWLQWSYGRRDNFEQYASANNLDPSTDTANYNFLQHELSGETGNHWSRGYSLEEYQNIQDPTQAAEYFMRGYERPAEATANLSARQEFARKLYENDHDCDSGVSV